MIDLQTLAVALCVGMIIFGSGLMHLNYRRGGK